MSGRILGLDPGERRIGVAVSDATGTIASPIDFIDRKGQDTQTRIKNLCAEWEVDCIVVGLPLGLDGSEGPAAVLARQLGDLVASTTGLAVTYHDERFTTVTAEQALIEGNVRRRKRTQKRDQVAAAVMLQSYLDRLGYRNADDDNTTT